MQQTGCGSNYISYTIAKGQTLYAIAQQFGTTVEAILAANPALDVQLYYAGDVICIPRAGGGGGGTGCNGTQYTVRRGDSFYLIAQRFGIPLASLLAANPGVDPAKLQIGQVICVPTGGVTPPPSRCPAGNNIHRVTRGQTFTDILVLYNISYGALRASNPNVNLNNLQAGQEICVPPSGSRGTCASGVGPYQMATGDTLSTLATRFRTSVSAILTVNANMTPTDFRAGAIICLPEGAVIGG